MPDIKSATIDSRKRIFLLSDIHANLPALQSVMPLITDDDVVICLGDMVGYYTEPNEVCEFIRSRANFTIIGNHDLYCVGNLPFKTENEPKYRVYATQQQLNDDHKNWLLSLPSEMILNLSTPVTINNKIIHHIHLAHGAPSNVETYIYPDNPFPADCCAPHTLLLLGHTHHPMIRTEEFGMVVNPGSVGQPRDWNPRPSCAVIDLSSGQIDHHRTTYDWHGYAQSLTAQNFHPESVSLLTRTRDAP